MHHRSKLDDLRKALEMIKRFDVLKEVNDYCIDYENKIKEPSLQLSKKSSDGEEDLKKKEADMLHQQLCKFFENKNNKTKQFNFKLCSNNSK